MSNFLYTVQLRLSCHSVNQLFLFLNGIPFYVYTIISLVFSYITCIWTFPGHFHFTNETIMNIFTSFVCSSVQSLSCVQFFATPWIAARQASLSITNTQSLPKLMVHPVSDAIQPSCPPLSPSPPAPNPSQHYGLLQWVNSSHEVAKVLKFQLQHQSFQWTPKTDIF